MTLLKGLPFLICFFLASTSQAQVSTSKASFEDSWSAELSTSINSSLHKTNDVERQMDMDIALSTSLKLDNGLKLSNYFSGNKELTGLREAQLNDTFFSLSGKMGVISSATINGKASIYIPLSESSVKNRKLKSALSLAPSAILPIGSTGLTVIFTPSLRYNYYEYTTALSGASNYQYSISNSLVLSYSLTDSFSLTSINAYSRSFTHGGVTTDSYRIGQELGFQASKKVGLTLGHIIGGSPLAPDGSDVDIDIFNSRESTVYFGIGLAI